MAGARRATWQKSGSDSTCVKTRPVDWLPFYNYLMYISLARIFFLSVVFDNIITD